MPANPVPASLGTPTHRVRKFRPGPGTKPAALPSMAANRSQPNVRARQPTEAWAIGCRFHERLNAAGNPG